MVAWVRVSSLESQVQAFFRVRGLGFSFRVQGFGSWVLRCPGFGFLKFKCALSGQTVAWFRLSGSRSRIQFPGSGFRVSGLETVAWQGEGAEVEGFGFRVQDLGFKDSDFGFRVSGCPGSGFWVPGFGIVRV